MCLCLCICVCVRVCVCLCSHGCACVRVFPRAPACLCAVQVKRQLRDIVELLRKAAETQGCALLLSQQGSAVKTEADRGEGKEARDGKRDTGASKEAAKGEVKKEEGGDAVILPEYMLVYLVYLLAHLPQLPPPSKWQEAKKEDFDVAIRYVGGPVDFRVLGDGEMLILWRVFLCTLLPCCRCQVGIVCLVISRDGFTTFCANDTFGQMRSHC